MMSFCIILTLFGALGLLRSVIMVSPKQSPIYINCNTWVLNLRGTTNIKQLWLGFLIVHHSCFSSFLVCF